MNNNFWNSLLTEKSWKILQELRKEHNFTLIGGWAIYLLTKNQKSKDIDIIIDINELEKFKALGLSKNDRLKKYEIKREEVDIDIYLEYYSKLTLPCEDIKDYSIQIEGFSVARPEIMLILKQGVYKERKDSIKGEKDKIDIASLIFLSEIDFKIYSGALKKYKMEFFIGELQKLLKEFRDFEKLGINIREFKVKKQKILERIRQL